MGGGDVHFRANVYRLPEQLGSSLRAGALAKDKDSSGIWALGSKAI